MGGVDDEDTATELLGVDLAGLSATTRRALRNAATAAAELGHHQVGTEHLLLGIYGVDGHAADALRACGATRAATRHKVVEAMGDASGDGPRRRPRQLSARATRSVGRARRFAHDGHSDAVDAEHLLLGVLDVEGNAGQVLRGVGVDVDQLRAALRNAAAGTTAPLSVADDDSGPTPSADPLCPHCGASLIDNLRHQRVRSIDRDDVASAVHLAVVSCAVCDGVVGIVR